MKIIHLVNGEYDAGAEQVQELVIRYQIQEGFKPQLIALIDGAFARRAREVGLPIEVLQMRHKADINIIAKLRNILIKHNVHLVHTHTVRSHLVGRLSALRTGVPVITHAHSHPLLETMPSWRLQINHQLERRTRRYSTHHICVTQWIANRFLAEGVEPSKVSVVPNGIDFSRFVDQVPPRTRVSSQELRALLNVEDEYLVGMVAFFRPIKGADVFLKALALVCEQGQDVHGVLIGDFEDEQYKQSLEEQMHQYNITGRFHFLGHRADVSKILSQLDLLVYPSVFGEGMPMTILEAMASGTPVVASNLGGIPDIIQDYKTGRLVSPNNARELASVISELCSNPDQTERMVERAHEMVKRCYGFQEMGRRISEIYNEVL